MPQANFTRRWCPTPEQLLVLQELYRGGMHTPNRFQIQQITARLSVYGKIEGKNVFYWFQNHKARERQKLRKRMLKQLELQYLLNRINAQAVQTQNQSCITRTHHHEETQELNYFSYKKAIRHEGGECSAQSNNGWVGLEINQAICYRKPLQTLDLFPIPNTGVKTEEKKDSPNDSWSNSCGNTDSSF